MFLNQIHCTSKQHFRKASSAITLLTVASCTAIGQPLSSDSRHVSELENPIFSADYPDSVESSSIGIDMTLDILIKILSELLAEPVEKPAQLDGLSNPLEFSADLLIIGYPLYGLSDTLSSIEIQGGIDDGQDLLDFLSFYRDDISLSEESQDQLADTVFYMMEELKSYE